MISQKKSAQMRDVFGFLFRHWRRHALLVSATMIATMLATLTDVFVPLYAGNLVTAVTGRHDARDLHAALFALGVMAALGGIQVAFRYGAVRGVIALSLSMMDDMAREAFFRVQRFASDWHANNFAGSIVRKITRGIWAVDLLNDTALLALLPALAVLAGSSVVLGLHWPSMGALVGAGALLYVGLTALFSLNYVSPAAQLSNRLDTAMGGALADAISCNAVVKAFAAEAREDAILARVIHKWRRRTNRSWKRGTNIGTGQGLALLVLRSAVTGLVVFLWWTGRASAGDVATVLTAYFIVLGYLRDIGFHIANVQRSVNEMEDMVRLEQQSLGIADQAGAQVIRVTQGGIRFDNVGFRYGAHAEPLFQRFSLAIPAGERVGLVGPSGSGKTTFVKLIQRLHDVTSGRILIDGQDVALVTQASLRAQIAIVAQEPILFHRSLAENIAYGKPGATQAEIEAAAGLANAHEFITNLPAGYRTLVGERGVKLSGGERQRVAIARAFLADAPILILDEATASLDSESEALIQDAVERLMTGRTVIVIAHRLSTVRALDRILVFDRGEIVEDGSHAGLVARQNGLYRRLFERQAFGLLTE